MLRLQQGGSSNVRYGDEEREESKMTMTMMMLHRNQMLSAIPLCGRKTAPEPVYPG